jgi:ribosome maturation factor RimP
MLKKEQNTSCGSSSTNQTELPSMIVKSVSRLLDVKLDEADWIQEHYYLEVSSPGLDRPLKKPADFERNRGKKVEVKLYQLMNGEKHV